MRPMSRRAKWSLVAVLYCPVAVPALGMAPVERSGQPEATSPKQLWAQTIELATAGNFSEAADTIRQLPDQGGLTGQVRGWLEEYKANEAARAELDRADFEKYVGYAKARIERKEYERALGWALAALDCSADHDAFLTSDWILDLVNDALATAQQYRKEAQKADAADPPTPEIAASEEEDKENDTDAETDEPESGWRKAWRVYSRLAALYEREPRFEKLEREALIHVRFEAMFREGSHWEERVEKVRWSAAKSALEYVDHYYVEPVDFKPLAESALEQLLLLAESRTAQQRLPGLADRHDRLDFQLRVQKHLDQVRAEPTLDRRDCVAHFRRVIEINDQTIRLPDELLVSELMDGALEPLDDFTTVIWPRASREFDKRTRGDFIGVGISIIKNRADEIEVVTPLEGTPAYRAGIQAGDIITDVDDISLKDFTINKVVDTIMGPKGTSVRLTIRRGDDRLEFDLNRAKVKIRSVKGLRRDPLDEERWDHWLDRDARLGYIRVTNFQRNTVEDLKNVLSDLVGLRGLVLDLRRNPGGLLDSAWQLSSMFLKAGDTVVSTKGRIKSEDHTFKTQGDGAYSDLPLVVLVDEHSASASEIVSGAVRDNGRGVVIGERTFGKFSVQNLMRLGRSQAKLKITTARYYLPSGASLHRNPMSETWGVEPDIAIRLVNKERRNVYQLWRKADLLGPAKPKKKDTELAENDEKRPEPDESKAGDQKTDKETDETTADPKPRAETDAKVADGEKKTEDAKTAEGELPPLDQPDENDRPEADPQLDAALVWLRVTFLSETYPTLATANVDHPADSALKP